MIKLKNLISEGKEREFALYNKKTMELVSRGLSSYQASYLLVKIDKKRPNDIDLIYDDEIKSVKIDKETGKAIIKI